MHDDFAELVADLARKESLVRALRPELAKEIVWADEIPRKTKRVLVYLHGFSASKAEIRPVPDIVASSLGANLFYTRLQGHGCDGAALAGATLEGWVRDLEEALLIASQIGDEIILIGCSTGATLASLIVSEKELSEQITGMVLISPNFGVNNPFAPLLTWPFARYWLPLLSGRVRSFEPRNAQHAACWTTTYPSKAVFPMAFLVKMATSQNFRKATVPALFIYSDEDKVVNAEATRLVQSDWKAERYAPRLTGKDDANAHVIAGEILSPAQTVPVARKIIEWLDAL